VATFRKRGPYQWQAQVRKKGYLLQTKTFDTRAAAMTWARVRIPRDAGHPFHGIAVSDSMGSRSLIPRQSGQRFHAIAVTF
jgi:hypothetical protein